VLRRMAARGGCLRTVAYQSLEARNEFGGRAAFERYAVVDREVRQELFLAAITWMSHGDGVNSKSGQRDLRVAPMATMSLGFRA